ncbi:hypothetical protein BU15DRAFT_40830 [Melanogaster broomeanus]|nr:hypothetical protein BU15DRAFT_40830 [Melanogaster broomeanus]
MARRPSTVTVTSPGSSKGPTESLRSPSAAVALSPSTYGGKFHSISQTGSVAFSSQQADITRIDPDELFTKHTIADVKAKQMQLRADAEAKQEELRLMVGERYRDLLQASTSIMCIATSAQRVQEALHETRHAIQSQRKPNMQSRVSHGRKEDSHLQMLQVLSAHIKLLLDAPEHLWRLIEREKYFQAAWLFLLARVVHRGLIRDAQEDESWKNHGIDVLEQFPLIQRQWETVSHFRSQIIHRATLSLRLYDKPCEETCATLLTLHILDSRPLTETLTMYLSQRTRTLNTLLSKDLDVPVQFGGGLPVIQLNGHSPEAPATPMKAPRSSAKAVAMAAKTSAEVTLEAISRTLGTARGVFTSSSSAPSLARRVLESMQVDVQSGSIFALPTELLLNTPAVLATLPSSTYFSLLPANIRSYKPFVDLSSASSSLSQEILRDKLDSWFDDSIASLRGALGKWFASLDVVDGVWKVRSSLRKWLSHSGLQAPELSNLSDILDEVASKRIMDIWKAALVRAEKGFVLEVGSLGSDNADEFSPLHSLYHPSSVPAPPLPGSGPSSLDLPFQTFRATLTQHLGGRTPRLHEVLRILEDVAISWQKDLARMSTDRENSHLISGLTEAYRPEVQVLCVNVASALTVSSGELMASPDKDTVMTKLIFHARVANELSTSSPFVSDIACDQAVVADFREKMDALFEQIIACWRERTISNLVSYYIENMTSWRPHSGPTSTTPSPLMMECLYSLSSSIHSLGMVRHQSHLMTIAQAIISKFSTAFIRAIDKGNSMDAVETLHDLTFLRHLASKWRNIEITSLEEAINKARSRVCYLYFAFAWDGSLTAGCLLQLTESSKYDPDRSASEFIARTQMLLSALLPPFEPEEITKENGDKMVELLAYGVPVIDSKFVPAVELAQPSSRFPLLLIDAR